MVLALVVGSEERSRYGLKENRTERLAILERLGAIESHRHANDLVAGLTAAITFACSHTARTRTHL